MIGFSLYPHHLLKGSLCTLESFCKMVIDVVDLIGVNNIGIGSDLIQNQPDEIVSWMRNGKWKKISTSEIKKDYFPKPTNFFKNNCDFKKIENGLKLYGLKKKEIDNIMGNNWFNFFKKVFQIKSFKNEFRK